jgi:hypothetical protein
MATYPLSKYSLLKAIYLGQEEEVERLLSDPLIRKETFVSVNAFWLKEYSFGLFYDEAEEAVRERIFKRLQTVPEYAETVKISKATMLKVMFTNSPIYSELTFQRVLWGLALPTSVDDNHRTLYFLESLTVDGFDRIIMERYEQMKKILQANLLL